jgi:hypothetical protein
MTAPPAALFPVDPSSNLGGFIDVDTQMLQPQIPYTGTVDLFGNASPELAPTLGIPEYTPNTITGSSGLDGDVGGFVNMPGPMVAVNPRGAWATLPFYHRNAGVQGGWMNTGDVPACNGPNITTSSLRVRGDRLPPQAYEADRRRLYDRLIREGADFNTAVIVHDVIFAAGVTIDALMAPIPTREMSLAYSRAKRMWQLLLEMKAVAPGQQKYCCLLCPVGNRQEYKFDRDAVRHFNRDHFGFRFPCDYW